MFLLCLQRAGVLPHPLHLSDQILTLYASARPSCQMVRPVLSIRRSARCDEIKHRLPLLGFQRSPLRRSSVGWCPVSGVSTESLRPTAAMLPAPPLLPFQRLQRYSPPVRLADGMPSTVPTLGFVPFHCHLLSVVTAPRHAKALRSVPLIDSGTALTRPPDRLDSASQAAHPLSPLVGFVRLSTERSDVSISPYRSALSALRDLRVLRHR